MLELLQALEASGFSMWVKETSTAYVGFLAFHTIGLVFLVGVSGVIAMRVLGAVRSMPLDPMRDYFPLMYTGLLINVVTGLVLICLYPTNYISDFSFYVKLVAIAVAAATLRKLRATVFDSGRSADLAALDKPAKLLSLVLLCAWLVATWAGRVIAYTLPTKLETAGALIVVLIMALLIGFAVRQLVGTKPSEQSA